MFRSYFFFFLVCLIGVDGIAQETLTWRDFADISFNPEYNKKYDVYLMMPTFGDQIKARSGKEVSIQGYFLDISGSGEVFLVSQNPMASCFFCGAAGPETVVEVNFKEKPSFRTDQIVVVTGVLQLNRDDWEHGNYILNEAVGELVN